MKRILFLISISCILIGCSEKPTEKALLYQENKEIIGAERDELIGDISDTIYDSIDRSNAEAEEINISPIEGLGEEIIPPEGRYTIQAGEYHLVPQSGRILVYDANESLLIDELLDSSQGVGSVTLDLNGKNTVHIDGIDNMIMMPVPTVISNELSAGIWEVGKDIEAGDYAVIPATDFAFGYLQVFEEGVSPRVFEFLDSSENSRIKVQLKDGQKLKISNLNLLQFEPQA